MKQRVGLVVAMILLVSIVVLAKTPKNLIFMIGDGMGFYQMQGAQVEKGAPLIMQTMPVFGFCTTFCADRFITDSAAAGTAIAAGHKTNYGMIGVTPDKTEIVSFLTVGGNNGKSTGIVTTCNLTHATPASFYAHAASRASTQDIAAFFPSSKVSLAIGGGIVDFEKRKDERNLSNELKKLGYSIQYNLNATSGLIGKKALFLLAEDHPAKVIDGRDYLPKAVEFAIQSLSKMNPHGFVLMVEGSQIDWGGHENSQQYNLTEVHDFDAAVGVALNFAKKDGNTLVIVTADHETGTTSLKSGSNEKREVNLLYNTKDHSAAYVPVFAFGPGSEHFGGMMDNTDFFPRILKLFKWKR